MHGPGFDSGKTLFVFPPVGLEYIVILPLLGPGGDGAGVPTGTALFVREVVAVFRLHGFAHGEIASAVFADPHPLLPLNTEPHTEVH